MGDIVVTMYDEDFIINRETGKGFGLIIEKISPLINSIVRKYNFNLEKEDSEQEIRLIAIEGIKSYNPNRGVKLSTFLHTHIHNKAISKLKSVMKDKNNASHLKNNNIFYNEINFNSVLKDDSDSIENHGILFKNNLYEINIDFNLFLEELKNEVEYDTWLLAKLISVESLSLREAAEKLNMNIWNAYNRIKKMSDNEFVKKFYEKENI